MRLGTTSLAAAGVVLPVSNSGQDSTVGGPGITVGKLLGLAVGLAVGLYVGTELGVLEGTNNFVKSWSLLIF